MGMFAKLTKDCHACAFRAKCELNIMRQEALKTVDNTLLKTYCVHLALTETKEKLLTTEPPTLENDWIEVCAQLDGIALQDVRHLLAKMPTNTMNRRKAEFAYKILLHIADCATTIPSRDNYKKRLKAFFAHSFRYLKDTEQNQKGEQNR